MSDTAKLDAIKLRLAFPETVPAHSWWTVLREDIKTLLKIIEKLEKHNGRNEIQSRKND